MAKQTRFKKRLIAIAHSMNVKVRFVANSTYGWADCLNKRIIIGTAVDNTFLKSIFFHELAHILLTREGKFRNYHWPRKYGYSPTKASRIALRAEQATDTLGAKLMKVYYPKDKFYAFYSTRAGKKFIKEYMANEV